MKQTILFAGVLSGLILSAVFVTACGGGGSGGGSAPTPTGMAAVVLRDGAVQSSDGRTVTSVFVEISKITLHTDGEGQHGDGNGNGGNSGNHESGNGNSGNNGNGQSGDNGGRDDGNDNHDDGLDVVVFDMGRDNGGVPKEVDLLTLTDSGMLFNMLRIPVGTYDEATVRLVGASAIFEDDPTQTPVPLAIRGDDHDGSQFEFEFHPPVVVDKLGTTIAAIDIVPVITLDGAGYKLSHDGDSDHTGSCEGWELQIDVEGTVTSVNGDMIELGDYDLQVDLSGISRVFVVPGMQIEAEGYLTDGVLVAHSFDFEN